MVNKDATGWNRVTLIIFRVTTFPRFALRLFRKNANCPLTIETLRVTTSADSVLCCLP
jgi:hypothetical protein